MDQEEAGEYFDIEGEDEVKNIIIEVSTVEISSDDNVYPNEEIISSELDSAIKDEDLLNDVDECDLSIIDKVISDTDSNSGVKHSLSDVEYEEDTSEGPPISNDKNKRCLKHVICIGGKSAVGEIEDDDNSMSVAENCIYTKQRIIVSNKKYVYSEGSTSILKQEDDNDTDNDEDNIKNDDDEEYIFDSTSDFNIVINEEANKDDSEKVISEEIYNLDENVASNVDIPLKEGVVFQSNNDFEEEIDVVNVATEYENNMGTCHCGRRKFRFSDIDNDDDDEDSQDLTYDKSECENCQSSASPLPGEYEGEVIEEIDVKDDNARESFEESEDNDLSEKVGANEKQRAERLAREKALDNDAESDNEDNSDNDDDDEDELVVTRRRENRAADQEIRNIMSRRSRDIIEDVVYNRDRDESIPKVLVLKNEVGGHYCKRLGIYKPTYAVGMEYSNEFSNPVVAGCSKDDDYTDSNTTIKNMIRSKPRPVGKNQQSVDNDDSDDSDDSDYSYQCLCVSPHEDDEYCEEDDEELDEREWNRIWRKRKYDGASTPTPPQCKKFCPDGSIVSGIGPDGTLLPGSNINGPPNVNQWLNSFLAWSKNEKIQAIDALINCCAASQVRHMMKTIEPLLQRDFISLLPKELALTVLGYLKPKDLLIAAQTCRYWRFLADDNLLWKEQCRRIGIMALKKYTRYIPRCANPWKAAYMKQYLIENNWQHRSVKTPLVLRGHDDHVITCLQFYGNRILSGSDDTTLKIWSAITGKCLRTLVGHAGGVWSSQMVGNLVVSGSTDRTLRVWEASTAKCLNILIGHTSTVRCLHLHQDIVVSGSRDATLRIWSIKDGKCLRVLIGHLAAVRCVQYNGKVVVSGAYDFYVKVWNPNTGECIHTLAGHTNRVYSLQFDGVHIVSGSLDTSIKVWDVETGQLKHTLVGHQSLTSGMELQKNILVSGNADSTVKVWDIATGHCLHTLSGPNKHQSAVTCIQSTNRFVITSSDDGTVKLWDLRTGEFIRNLVELNSGGSGGVVWRIRASATKLFCAVGSRNGTEETKLLVLDFDTPGVCRKCEE